MTRPYKRELEQERKILGDLFRQREELATKIAKQQTRVAALTALTEESEVRPMTEMDLGLMPTELRSSLEQLRFPMRTHKNILSSIHTVIKRLEQGGEIRKAMHDINSGLDISVYQWAGPNYGASNSLANQMADAERESSRRRV
jgi:hypothetical protein